MRSYGRQRGRIRHSHHSDHSGRCLAPSVVSLPTASSAEPTVGMEYCASTGTWSGTPDIAYA